MSLIDDVLDGLRLHSTVFSRMTLSGDWGFAKDPLSGAPFHLILSGEACVKVEDGEAVLLRPGDLAMLPHGERHRLLAHPAAPSLPWRDVVENMGWTQWSLGQRFKSVDLRLGHGNQVTRMISGVFAFGDHRRNPLLSALPGLLVVRSTDDTAPARSIATVAALLDAELLSGNAAAESVAARLADILFILVVRSHVANVASLPPGWLRGVADPELAPALALMHGSPDRPWSVLSLARELGMSRSRFAARFQTVVGQSPLDYLTRWRMYLAAQRLTNGKSNLSVLASSLGYRSDVAFSKAFRRWAGRSPSAYRRDANRTDQSNGHAVSASAMSSADRVDERS